MRAEPGWLPGLRHAMQPNLVLNLQSSCLSIQTAKITGTHVPHTGAA